MLERIRRFLRRDKAKTQADIKASGKALPQSLQDAALHIKEQGDVLLAQGDLSGAEVRYREAIAANPEFAVAYYELAHMLYAQGRLTETEHALTRAVAIRPDNADAHHLLAHLLRIRGENVGAERHYNVALANAPQVDTIFLDFAVFLFEQNRADEASRLLAKGISIIPTSMILLLCQGNILNHLAQFDEAIATFRTVLALEPDHVTALNNLGLLLSKRGSTEDAIATFRRVVQLAPRLADAHNNLGRALQQAGDLDLANASYRQAIEIDPKFTNAHFNLGILAASGNQLELAAQSLTIVTELDPANVDAHYHLGVILQTQAARADFGVKADLIDAAANSFQAALAIRPDHVHANINLGAVFQEAGKLDEAISCFRKALAFDYGSVVARFNLAKIHQDRNETSEAIALYEQVISADECNVDAHAQLGMLHHQMGNVDRAVLHLKRACELTPDRTVFHINLGFILQGIDRRHEAMACYDRALSLDPLSVEAHCNMGTLLREESKTLTGNARTAMLEQALRNYRAAIASNSRLVNTLVDSGAVQMALMRNNDAMESFELALAMDPGHVGALFNRGLLSLLAGDFDTGWRGYEYRHEQVLGANPYVEFDRPLWLNDADIKDKAILLCSEQGLGDTIHFIRYLEKVVALGPRTIYLQIQKTLVPLLNALKPPVQILSEGEALPPFDFYCPLTSLPLAFKTNLDNIPCTAPYLTPPQDRYDHWAHLRTSKRSTGVAKIGFSWSGNPAFSNDFNRSMSIEKFSELFGLTEFEFFSLQKDAHDSVAVTLRQHGNVVDLTPQLQDFADTAAVIANLDLVISVDTAVAHLAGALGTPVWIMLPFAPDFRWLTERVDSPWYPSARLFRQKAIGDWDDVLQEIRDALKLEFSEPTYIIQQ